MAEVISIVRTGIFNVHYKLLKFTITFSEPVTGFDAGDVLLHWTGNITGATVSSVTAVPGSGGSSYTISVSAAGAGTVSLGVAGDIRDLTGGDAFAPGFGPAIIRDFGMASSPEDLVVGDFNHDGNLDMLVAVFTQISPLVGRIGFLKGHGDGTFDPLVNIITGSTTGLQIDMGDVNGDGRPDLAVQGQDSYSPNPSGNLSDTYLKILLGNGDGTFTLLSESTTVDVVDTSVALSDLNHDGRADLISLRWNAATNPNQFSLVTRLSDPGGMPGATVLQALPPLPKNFVLADLNGDGKLDAAVTTQSGYSVLLGNGDGTFQSAQNVTVSGGTTAIAAADVNEDGKVDLVIGSRQNSSISARVLFGNGDGTFQQSQALTTGQASPASVAIVDMNGDGTLDIVMPGALFLNNGGGIFGAREPIPSGAGFGRFATGDFDNNGTPDLLAPGQDVSREEVHLQLTASYRITTPDDFDGDGRSDILWRNTVGTTEIWEMNGLARIGGGNTASQTINAWKIQGIGDFNGDGRSDILWRDDPGATAIWMLDGTRDVSHRFSSADPAWKVQAVGDFNGDGTSDILWRHNDGTTAIWLMKDGVSFGGYNTSLQNGNSWKVQAAGDFDGDGKADILWRNDDGTTQIWFMNGTQALAASGNTGSQLDTSWKFQDIGDFNGDGKDDILWRNDAGRTQIWFMDGKTQIGGGDTFSQAPNVWQVEKVDDYNGDGKADILWRNADSSTFIWLMDGTHDIGSGFTTPQHASDWSIF